jgi:MFS family permease
MSTTRTPNSIEPDEREHTRAPLGRLLGWIAPAYLCFFLLWGAIPTVLLPLQMAGIDEENKVANLAIVTTIGAFAAMLAQPLAGTLSDRTRSRFGKRAPWIVGGAVAGGLALIGMAAANGVVQIAIAWVVAQIAYNCVQGPLTTVLPDRVPSHRRGIFAAVTGMAGMLGAIGGQAVGANFAENIPGGYLVLAGLAIVALTLFVVFNPDKSSKDQERTPLRVVDFLKTFWVNPRKNPDFFWAFLGRLFLYTGYFAVTGYNLYILQDHVGLGADGVGQVAVLGLVALLGMLPAIIIAGALSDKLRRRRVFIFISSLLVGVGMLFPWIAPTLTSMLLMSFIAGVGFGAFQAVDQALMTEVLPDAASYGKDLGVVNIAATLPQTLAPGVGGAIVLAFGYAGLFPVGIALSLLGAFAVYLIKSVR